MMLKHELWKDDNGLTTFCLAGSHGDGARGELLGCGANVIWTVEAGSHFDAMTAYWDYMGWGTYTTDQELDYLPYPEDWADGQQ